MRSWKPAASLATFCLFAILPASAIPLTNFTFCGTGATSCASNGASLGVVAGNATSGQDLNWGITFTNDGTNTTPGNTYVTQPCGNFGDCNGAAANFPFNDWVSSSSNQWISPFTGDGSSLPPTGGEYDFTETFSLSGIVSSAEIIGNWATDNCLMGIYVNGTLVAGTGACTTDNNYSAKTAFDITSAFNYGGTNTMTFKTDNVSGVAPNPSGLLVEVTSATGASSATQTPEPVTALTLGLGLVALGFARRRRA